MSLASQTRAEPHSPPPVGLWSIVVSHPPFFSSLDVSFPTGHFFRQDAARRLHLRDLRQDAEPALRSSCSRCLSWPNERNPRDPVPFQTTPGSIARSTRGTLRSYSLGALPILDHLLKRMKLEEFLRDYLPKERRGCPDHRRPRTDRAGQEFPSGAGADLRPGRMGRGLRTRCLGPFPRTGSAAERRSRGPLDDPSLSQRSPIAPAGPDGPCRAGVHPGPRRTAQRLHDRYLFRGLYGCRRRTTPRHAEDPDDHLGP